MYHEVSFPLKTEWIPFGGIKIMKRLITFILSILFVYNFAFAQQPSAEDIISKVNDLMNQKSVYVKMKMNIVTTSGKIRTFEYDSWSKGSGEKNLIRYTKPARVKGQAILMLNNADDIWTYFPRTKRVRKLATHAKKQKMQGSDFSYADMGSGDSFITDFNAKIIQEEKKEKFDCYKLELDRKNDINSPYSRMIIWVIKENYVPVVIDYYDEKNPDRRMKTLVQYDIQVIDGVPTGKKMIMYNKQDNTQTSVEMVELKYNSELSDEMFTERGLKK